MATNFDYLKQESKFSDFSDIAISAEKMILINIDACLFDCRRAMEFAIKWMYSVDEDLVMPYQDDLYTLMYEDSFKKLVPQDLLFEMDYIRKTSNKTIHTTTKFTYDIALLCLKNLSAFFDFVSCCYSDNYEEHVFDEKYINERKDKIKQSKEEAEQTKQSLLEKQNELEKKELDLQKLIDENAQLKDKLSARRKEQQGNYIPKPLELSEYETRKLYIDSMLLDAGWVEGVDWINEVELTGMPTESGKGFADYVLYDDTFRPLAVIEAKKTCVDVAKGRQQAKLYADILEEKYGRRPVIFLTNGFETHIIDGKYPERKCSFIYSKRDLEKWFNLLATRTSLKNITVDHDIAGRYYQEAAIKAVCDELDEKNKRKALLVMATGSGKTRTVIALCDVLLKNGWVKNILFLADRNALVTQAKRNFVNLLESLSCTNLAEEKDNYSAHCVLSTYQTMINCIDNVRDDKGRIFTCGHFDLVICDEAHRSIYNKYQDIFNYFDAPLIGLTATPKDEIDKNTYEIFELRSGDPTYGYELAQAVKDGYLVDFVSIESKLKFLEEGIIYDELSEEDKEQYEATFENENGEVPEAINSSALNTWIFNEDTIRQVLDTLMTSGIKIDYGQKIGKTIIFAKNHLHAEKILEVFNKYYPHLPNYARVIDNYMTYAQSAIDEFSNPNKMPQIAISVDMLDTGIDIPEILNLVFFKKVLSKAKFWQMIGRGTRTCEGLLDGEDKKQFYIFDFCNNFEFFRMGNGAPAENTISIQSAIYNLKFEISYKLQDIDYQTEKLIAYRNSLVKQMSKKVRDIPRDSFATKQHQKYVDMYSVDESYQEITYPDVLIVRREVSPLLLPDSDDADAQRFDALMYGIEVAYLVGKRHGKAKSDLIRRVRALSEIAHIPQIQEQKEFISTVLNTSYVDEAGVNEFEEIRNRLRDLMKYIPRKHIRYDTNFDDELLSAEWHEADLESDELNNYRQRAEFYIRQHQDNNPVIVKLKTNKPLSESDIEELEEILWSEIGSQEEYFNEYGTKPLGEFVREIVGLDMNAAKEAFAEYLTDSDLDSRQIYFVNQIVEYIVHNGMMKDFAVLQEPPFTNQGSIVEIFKDVTIWNGIRKVIEQINANAA